MKLHLYCIACILNMIVLTGYTVTSIIKIFITNDYPPDGASVLFACIVLLFIMACLIKNFIGYRYAINLQEHKWIDPAYLHRFYFLYVLQALLFLLFAVFQYLLMESYTALFRSIDLSVITIMRTIALFSVPTFLLTTAYILVTDIALSKRINNQSHLFNDLLQK